MAEPSSQSAQRPGRPKKIVRKTFHPVVPNLKRAFIDTMVICLAEKMAEHEFDGLRLALERSQDDARKRRLLPIKVPLPNGAWHFSCTFISRQSERFRFLSARLNPSRSSRCTLHWIF